MSSLPLTTATEEYDSVDGALAGDIRITLKETEVIDTAVNSSSAIIRQQITKKPKWIVPVIPQAQGFVEDIKQVFAGVVTKIEGDDITARLSDLTDHSKPDEEVKFGIDELDEREFDVLEVGAQFHWHIGYRQGDKVPKQRFSIIKFRRLPRWKQVDIDTSKAVAEEYAEFFRG